VCGHRAREERGVSAPGQLARDEGRRGDTSGSGQGEAGWGAAGVRRGWARRGDGVVLGAVRRWGGAGRNRAVGMGGREDDWPPAQVEAGRRHLATVARGVPGAASRSAGTGEEGHRPGAGLGGGGTATGTWGAELDRRGGGELGHRRRRLEAGRSISVGTPSSRW